MESSVPVEMKPYKVVVGIDLSPMSIGVLRQALQLANTQQNSEVHAVLVADYDQAMLGLHGLTANETPSDAAVRLQKLATSVVGELTASSGLPHVQRVVTHLLVGSPAQEIVWLAAHEDADLIVVGTHGRRGVTRLWLGSVAERVVRLAGCPVCVARDKQHDAAWRVPEIEPPCPDCLAVRNASNGAKIWCERHQSHLHSHVYSSGEAPTRAFTPWGFSA